MLTTRAPSASAIICDPSVLPLSATSTSPLIPLSVKNFIALLTQLWMVSASFRHGINIVNSTGRSHCPLVKLCGQDKVDTETGDIALATSR
jgi:hypothetical protein